MTALKSTLSYPGVMQHAQQIGRALHEAGELEAFVTTFAFDEESRLAQQLKGSSSVAAQKLLRQLRRRAVTEIPRRLVRRHPFWEVARTAGAKLGASPEVVDRLWDLMSHRFDQLVADRYVPVTRSIHAFEYTALASFRRASTEGATKVLHLPSLDSKRFEEIRAREHAAWPQLQEPADSYFAGKFAARYERRLEEIRQADVIIVNSSLTKKSHVDAGADPGKIQVVSLGAPAPVDGGVDGAPRDLSAPLKVMWAGSFRLGKGAHYFIEAWRTLGAGAHAKAEVFGTVDLPPRMLGALPLGIEFRGSVSQQVLFDAYEHADVLVFPTLSDGFGMVVTEAFSRGLPVICTTGAGACDLVEHHRNGLVIPPAESAALADALQWCLDNRSALAAMRVHALATARANQWAHYRAKLNSALQTGLAGHARYRHG